MRRRWVALVGGLSVATTVAAVGGWMVADDGSGRAASAALAASGALRKDPGAVWRATGEDPWDVFVCNVPAGATASAFGALPLRLDLDPSGVAAVLNRHVTTYFDAISHGAYRPTFHPATTVSIGVDDEPQECVDHALAQASTTVRGVFVVADAEQAADQPGGFATMGDECGAQSCSAARSRRAVYVGASDFHPSWGDRPPMDLVEHELGHAIGWPHSGYDAAARSPHQSGLDVMSDSAAPRSIDPERRDAPDTLAINRLAVGWLPTSDVTVITVPIAAGGRVVQLQPSTGVSGTRLAVVPLGAAMFLTIEWLPAEGFDDHLPSGGVAVHLVDGVGPARTQAPLVGSPPYTSLLRVGEELAANGVRIAVEDTGNVRVTSA